MTAAEIPEGSVDAAGAALVGTTEMRTSTTTEQQQPPSPPP